jgi:cyclopropane fatty-acyl-phospholipid synthase-like methyltransferase
MGKLRPVRAVTSEYATVEECLASGADVVGLLDRLGVLRADAVTLQIGSGLGRVEAHLHSRVKECHGIDVSPSMVRRSRALVPHRNVFFYCTDGRNLERWPDGYFSLIYSFLVFQHLPRSQFHDYVGDSFKKLSKGGHFVFQIMIDDTESQEEPPLSHPYGLRHYTRGDVLAQLLNAGFVDVRATDLRGIPDRASTPMGDLVYSARRA